jgi:hypothetical protein
LGCIGEVFVILRFAAALCLLPLLPGCTYVLKAGYPARQVEVKLPEGSSANMSFRVGKTGSRVFANSEGVVEFELPEIPRRCDTYLFYPGIPWQRYSVPDVFVMSGDRVLRRVSLVKLHHEAESSAMPMELPFE